MTLEFAGPGTRLQPGNIEAVAAALQCEPAVIRAVCDIEAPGGGFLPDGRPKILFEAHVFGRETDHQWDDSHPNVSAPRWDRSLYGATGAHQHDRLQAAIRLDREAALKSCSWGMFQVLGKNAAACGFTKMEDGELVADVETFVAAMVTGERAHLAAFAAFCRSNRLDRFLRTSPPDFASFARGYNGPGYAVHAYDTKLAAAWRKWRAAPAGQPATNPPEMPDNASSITPARRTLRLTSPPMTGPDVVDLQKLLGPIAGIPDGRFGKVTASAVESFQQARELEADGVVGQVTWAALDALGAER